MSMGLYQTDNYIWNSSDCLGEGSYGKVYCAIHKQTGEKVAVKTFKFVNPQISREMRMLQTLKHPYIIQFLGVEVDHISGGHVIVTEFCSGGSLMQFLNEPENVNGLVDEEFLLVIEHLSGGLEYLKRHDVIHRDVKPDNIMRHIEDDGGIIYKLADFGTARELPEGENFTSLHGTEPYLHPQLYKACFFRDPNLNREFGPDTDLWSIGVTLYHIATGVLPFRVSDRNTMLNIYNEMRENSGIISAVQEWDNDRVTFSKTLPLTSRLSMGLKQLVTLIIAGLFIQDHFHKWTFTRYYEEVKKLTAAKAVQIFYVNKMKTLKVYLSPDETFDDFQNYVLEQTGINPENQVFFNKEKLVSSLIDVSRKNCDNIFLLDKTNRDIEPVVDIKLKYGTLANFPSKFMNSTDIRLVFLARKDLCLCTQLMEYQSKVCDSFISFIEYSDTYCNEQLKEQRKISDHLLEKYDTTNGRVKILSKLQTMNQSDLPLFIKDFASYTNSLIKEVSQLMEKIAETGNSHNWNHKCHISYLKTAEKELRDMKTLHRNLIEDKRLGRQEYECEKLKIVHCVTTILQILTDKMEPHFEIFIQNVKRWYTEVFWTRMLALVNLKKQLHRFRCALKKFEAEIQTQCDKNLEIIKERRISYELQNLTDLLSDYERKQSDIHLVIEENREVLKKLKDLDLEPLQYCDDIGTLV